MFYVGRHAALDENETSLAFLKVSISATGQSATTDGALIGNTIVTVMKPPVVRCDFGVELPGQIATTDVNLPLGVC